MMVEKEALKVVVLLGVGKMSERREREHARAFYFLKSQEKAIFSFCFKISSSCPNKFMFLGKVEAQDRHLFKASEKGKQAKENLAGFLLYLKLSSSSSRPPIPTQSYTLFVCLIVLKWILQRYYSFALSPINPPSSSSLPLPLLSLSEITTITKISRQKCCATWSGIRI